MSEKVTDIFGGNQVDITELHGWHHEDYEVAKRHIRQSVGSIDDLRLTGKQMLVGVYVRPIRLVGSLQIGRQKTQRADWYEGKAALILKLGPDAFSGDDSYLAAMFGDEGAPKVGDWIFTNANSGIQISYCGVGATRPKFENMLKKEQDVYDWAYGWPCRIILDENILGIIKDPHTVV